VSVWTVYDWVRDGRLPAVRMGRRILFRAESFDAEVRAAEKTAGAPAEPVATVAPELVPA
jgi:excisionase family DNA binding protein